MKTQDSGGEEDRPAGRHWLIAHQLIRQQNVEAPQASTVPEASPPLGMQVPAA
jgi:hypothetical protein